MLPQLTLRFVPPTRSEEERERGKAAKPGERREDCGVCAEAQLSPSTQSYYSHHCKQRKAVNGAERASDTHTASKREEKIAE